MAHKLTDSEDFNPDVFKKKSSRFEGLCKWVLAVTAID
jgi:hypothetical protein